MNRRTFLRSIATVCGAAVVCSGELLKPAQPDPGFYDFNPFGSETERKKYRQNIFIKARQQGITTMTFDGFATQRDGMIKIYQGAYY